MIERIKKSWNDMQAEVLKGAIKGQIIRIINPSRYIQLNNIRPKRKLLIETKERVSKEIKKSLSENRINIIKLYSRIKTIGSLDRKERYYKSLYYNNPTELADLIKEDLIGITIITKDNKDCYKVLDVFKKIGKFPSWKSRKNPRNYSNSNKTKLNPCMNSMKSLITGNILIKDIPYIVHFVICSQEAHNKLLETRKEYKTKIKHFINKE